MSRLADTFDPMPSETLEAEAGEAKKAGDLDRALLLLRAALKALRLEQAAMKEGR